MADVKKIIKDLGGSFDGSNEEQMKGVQLLKGLATNDEKEANEFMKKLDKATTKISKEMSESVEENGKTAKCPDCGGKYLVQTGYCVACKKKVKKESVIEIQKEVKIPGTNIILEKGDKIQVLEGNNPYNTHEYFIATLDDVTNEYLVLEGFNTYEEAIEATRKWKREYPNIEILDYDPAFR